MFNDLDVQDDKLMLDLAVFLNRLVRKRNRSFVFAFFNTYLVPGGRRRSLWR